MMTRLLVDHDKVPKRAWRSALAMGVMLIMTVACVHRAPVAPVSPLTSYVSVGPPLPPAVGYDPKRAHDTPLALFDVPELSRAALRDGERELRISVGGGMMYTKTPLLRLVESAGKVRGEVYHEWMTPWDAQSRETEKGWFISTAKGRPVCVEPRRDGKVTACQLRFGRTPSWARLMRTLDSLGVWTITPIVSNSTLSVSDQPTMLIERRVGARYEVVSYYGVYRRDVKAIYDLMDGEYWP